MGRNFFAIIVAGGSGTRMGASVPKQFLDLGGKLILQRTIERFLEADPDVRIVTVLPADHIEFWKNHCAEQNFNCPQIIVEGGFTRFHSVKAALAKIPDNALVAVHDGVRPLVSADLIRRMKEKMSSSRALIPVLPVTETLKALKLENGELKQIDDVTIDRSVVYAAQTPQMFLSEDIKAAYRLPYNTLFTDDASVAQAKKIPLSFIEGERYNIKITTPQDLDAALKLVLL